jgi:hypothetical protein
MEREMMAITGILTKDREATLALENRETSLKDLLFVARVLLVMRTRALRR